MKDIAKYIIGGVIGAVTASLIFYGTIASKLTSKLNLYETKFFQYETRLSQLEDSVDIFIKNAADEKKEKFSKTKYYAKKEKIKKELYKELKEKGLDSLIKEIEAK